MTNAPPGRDAIRAQAAHWFNLRCSGDMTAEDDARLARWLDATHSHRDAYQRVERAWAIAGSMANDPALAPPPATRAPLSTETPAPIPQPWRKYALSIAASIALMLGVGWATAPHLLGHNNGPEWRDQVFRTGTGQRTRVTLTDGSIVSLDAETEMRVQTSAKERRLDLIRGRAYFQVAHDPSRPFIVQADGKHVRAIGTAFEVSLEQGRMSVILIEGKVRVEGDKHSAGTVTDMVPGRQLLVSTDASWALKQVDVEKETSWTKGRLIFMHDPLSKAVAEVNRYSTRKLVFEDDRIPTRQIVGVFEVGDVEGFVKALELNGIAYRTSATGDKILMADKPE